MILDLLGRDAGGRGTGDAAADGDRQRARGGDRRRRDVGGAGSGAGLHLPEVGVPRLVDAFWIRAPRLVHFFDVDGRRAAEEGLCGCCGGGGIVLVLGIGGDSSLDRRRRRGFRHLLLLQLFDGRGGSEGGCGESRDAESEIVESAGGDDQRRLIFRDETALTL